MSVVNGLGHRPRVTGRALRGERPLADHLREGAALDVIHGKIWMAVALPGFVNAHDVGVLQFGHGFRFTAETEHLLWARELTGENHFQSHNPVQAELSGAINHPHAAARHFLQQFVLAKAPARRPRFARWLESALERTVRAQAFRPIIRQRTPALRTVVHWLHK
jgi:hypothetical protein